MGGQRLVWTKTGVDKDGGGQKRVKALVF